MAPSFLQIAIVVVLILILFGRGKISGLMSEMAQGIKSFKKGIAEDGNKVEGAVGETIEAEAAADSHAAGEAVAGKDNASQG